MSSLLDFVLLRSILFFARLPLRLAFFYPAWNRFNLVPRNRSIHPVAFHAIPSSSSHSRSIRIRIHHPHSSPVAHDGPRPVHVNLHGSGFVLPCLGADAELCQLIADSLDCLVIDADYAKAPEFPFPAALHDVLDVIRWVLAHPDQFDTDRITIGGQSAGGNLALSATASLPKGTIKAVATFYPSTDFTRRGLPDDQRMYKPYIPGKTPGWALGRRSRLLFTRCYIPNGTDTKDPRLSPFFADPNAFPPVFVATGDADPLCKEGEEFVQKLVAAGVDAHFMLIPDAGHGWDRAIRADDPKFVPLRTLALERLVDHLRKAQSGALAN